MSEKEDLIIPGCPKCVGVLVFFPFSVSLLDFPSPPHSSFLPVHLSSHSLLFSLTLSLALMGPRPCGLEEDVRQYEQDLAKRLYQARVRASQGTPETPQPPTSSASSSASQLRSAPRPQPPGADARHHRGCAGVLWHWVFC